MVIRTPLTRLVPLTCSLLQFSPNSAANCGIEQSPATGNEVFATSIVIPTFESNTANYVREQSPETERRRVDLPKELSKYVIELSCESTAKGGVCDVYVVGVTHCSKESKKQVESIVKLLKPDVVFLELCENRAKVLFKYEIPTEEEMIVKRKQTNIIFYWFISWLNAELENCEFRSAFREANKYGGKVVLGDRPIEITSKRIWRNLPFWHILRSVIPCFPSNFSTSLSIYDNIGNWSKLYFSKRLPTIPETNLHERDRYMSHLLLTVASESRTIVAIVGKDHLEGMKKIWKQPVKIQDIEDLMTIPPPNPNATVGIVVVVGAMISTLFRFRR